MESRRKDGGMCCSNGYRHRPNACGTPGVEAPVNLGGFFGIDSDESSDEQGRCYINSYDGCSMLALRDV